MKRKIASGRRGNVAFKCTYCDGGKTAARIGFAGICGDETMRRNIEDEKHVWCRTDSACHKYLDGKISRGEIELPCCYESQMLTHWKAFAGIHQTGENHGKPFALRKVRKGHICVLTSRKPGMDEDERFIFGIFRIDDIYDGDNWETGHVMSMSEFRIELTEEQAQKFKFWEYYSNLKSPEIPKWSHGLFRYLTDEMSAQILRDAIDKTTNKTLAKRFFDDYCENKGIEPSALPKPHGALTLSLKRSLP
jgi:hypothetical protein